MVEELEVTSTPPAPTVEETEEKSYVEPLVSEVLPYVDASEHIAKEATGKLVVIEKGGVKVWGVMGRIPVTERMHEDYGGLQIPENITHVDVLQMNPQQMLHPTKRLIRSNIGYSSGLIANTMQSTLDTEGGIQQIPFGTQGVEVMEAAMGLGLTDFTPAHKPGESNAAKINEVMRASDKSRILFIEGHGGGQPWTIGEQYGDTPPKVEGYPQFAVGNQIEVQAVIDYVEQNEEPYAAIVVKNCNFDKSTTIHSEKTPVFYVTGLSQGVAAMMGENKPVVYIPEEK